MRIYNHAVNNPRVVSVYHSHNNQPCALNLHKYKKTLLK